MTQDNMTVVRIVRSWNKESSTRQSIEHMCRVPCVGEHIVDSEHGPCAVTHVIIVPGSLLAREGYEAEIWLRRSR